MTAVQSVGSTRPDQGSSGLRVPGAGLFDVSPGDIEP